MFELPKLPYALDELEPHFSKETLEYHYGKHHQAYVNNLNQLTKDLPLATASLESIILQEEGSLFNNAAQIWNHSFYWNCLTPHYLELETGPLANAINKNFGSFENFKTRFNESALALFGSGWTWLEKNTEGELAIINTSNAHLPMKSGKKALLVCDIWEHAYYIDHRNMRANYLAQFWKTINWSFVTANFNAD